MKKLSEATAAVNTSRICGKKWSGNPGIRFDCKYEERFNRGRHEVVTTKATAPPNSGGALVGWLIRTLDLKDQSWDTGDHQVVLFIHAALVDVPLDVSNR